MYTNPLNSTMRIQGMASGLETDALVRNLMFAEQLKVKRVMQDKLRMEWRLSAQQETRNLISDFRNKTMSVLSPETNMAAASAYNTRSVTIINESNLVNISAQGSALNGQNKIDYITNIAKASNIQSDNKALQTDTLNLNLRLEEIAFSNELIFAGENEDTIAFSINDKDFVFKSTDTMRDVFNAINYGNAGVKINYSELTGKFNIQTTLLGSESKIEITNTAGNFFGAAAALGIADGIIQNGQNALLSINGVEVTRATNNFSIDGINYSLMATTNSEINFRVDNNIEPAVDRIKQFISLYNDLIDSLQEKLNEKVYPDFFPLNEEDKEGMSEKEIELWDEKAKSGQLRNDRTLRTLLGDLRKMLYDVVAGIGKSPADIGLQTGHYSQGGKISLNETKLRSALSENPDEVMRIFTQEGSESNFTSKYNQSGLITKMREKFVDYQGTLNTSKVNQDIEKISHRINSLNQQMLNKENFYYQRFAAMEKAISMMQSQSAWLSQQLF